MPMRGRMGPAKDARNDACWRSGYLGERAAGELGEAPRKIMLNDQGFDAGARRPKLFSVDSWARVDMVPGSRSTIRTDLAGAGVSLRELGSGDKENIQSNVSRADLVCDLADAATNEDALRQIDASGGGLRWDDADAQGLAELDSGNSALIAALAQELVSGRSEDGVVPTGLLAAIGEWLVASQAKPSAGMVGGKGPSDGAMDSEDDYVVGGVVVPHGGEGPVVDPGSEGGSSGSGPARHGFRALPNFRRLLGEEERLDVVVGGPSSPDSPWFQTTKKS